MHKEGSQLKFYVIPTALVMKKQLEIIINCRLSDVSETSLSIVSKFVCEFQSTYNFQSFKKSKAAFGIIFVLFPLKF